MAMAPPQWPCDSTVVVVVVKSHCSRQVRWGSRCCPCVKKLAAAGQARHVWAPSALVLKPLRHAHALDGAVAGARMQLAAVSEGGQCACYGQLVAACSCEMGGGGVSQGSSPVQAAAVAPHDTTCMKLGLPIPAAVRRVARETWCGPAATYERAQVPEHGSSARRTALCQEHRCMRSISVQRMGCGVALLRRLGTACAPTCMLGQRCSS
jgi:hypothetical protein